MNKISKFNGERLKSARLFRGLTLTDISKETDISKQSLSLYENNKNIPNLGNSMKLSQILKFPYEFFFQNNQFRIKTKATYFRDLLSTNKKDRTEQSIKLEYLAQIYLVLAKYIEFPMLNIPNVHFQSANTSYEYGEAEELVQLEVIATRLREHWGLGTVPIKDLRYTLESNGILITRFDTNAQRIDAFSQKTIVDNRDVFFIVISKNGQSTSRARFDMSHELSHILLHPWNEDQELISKDEFKARERQANMLVIALLLPKESFTEDVSKYPTNLEYYKHLKDKWNVSIQAMLSRTHQLGVITTNQFQYLMRKLSKIGWRNAEPGDIVFLLKDNLLQSAVDMIISNKVLTGVDIVNEIKENGIAMHSDEIEILLCLRSGTLGSIKKIGLVVSN